MFVLEDSLNHVLVVEVTETYMFLSFSQTTLRVWDVLFYEGAKVLFHVALAIFKVTALNMYYIVVSRGYLVILFVRNQIIDHTLY